MPTAQLEPGQVLGGDYRIRRLLGRRALFASYLAEEVGTLTKRAVVLRVPEPELLAHPPTRLAFFREVLAPMRLKGRGTAPLLDLGLTEQGGSFVAREYVAGQTLAERMAAEAAAPLQVRQALGLAWTIASILLRAHRRGVYHRALRPANIILTDSQDDRGGLGVCLVDFGVSELLAPSLLRGPEGRLSLPGSESPHLAGVERAYEAPESAHSGLELALPTPEEDVYSLGAITYRLLGGRDVGVRIGADEKPGTVHREDELKRLAPLLPPEVVPLLGLMMDEKPEQRPPLDRVHAVLKEAIGDEGLRRQAAAHAPAPRPVREKPPATPLPEKRQPEPERLAATRGPSAPHAPREHPASSRRDRHAAAGVPFAVLIALAVVSALALRVAAGALVLVLWRLPPAPLAVPGSSAPSVRAEPSPPPRPPETAASAGAQNEPAGPGPTPSAASVRSVPAAGPAEASAPKGPSAPHAAPAKPRPRSRVPLFPD